MFFSVIIPVYNVEKYLRECVDSVLTQSFSDFEVILVDDGSKDNSGAICDEYSKNDRRVRTIHKVNGGLSDARNVGLEAAIGDYVVFIDSDDYIANDTFLKTIYDKAQSSADIILYKFKKYFEDTNRMGECGFSYAEIVDEYEPEKVLLSLVKNDGYYGSAWTKAIQRSILIDNDIHFEKGLLGEDMEWYYHVVLKSKKIAAIDYPYIVYRQREGSITSTHKLKNLTDYIYILEKWKTGVEKSNVSDDFKVALNGSLAKYYANLLIVYERLGDNAKKGYKSRIKKLSTLLNYSMSKRPQLVAKVYKLFGFYGTIFALKILDKVKGK